MKHIIFKAFNLYGSQKAVIIIIITIALYSYADTVSKN